MIKLEISGLIFFYTFFSVIIILAAWIFIGYKAKKLSAPRDANPIWKCSVCSHVYVDSRHEDISTCPLCNSYNKREKKR